MEIVVLWLIALFLALALGSYRIRCVMLEQQPGEPAFPRIWRSRVFRIGSWIMVAILSLGFASLSALIVHAHPLSFDGYIWMGFFLLLRWQVSALIALVWVKWKRGVA